MSNKGYSFEVETVDDFRAFIRELLPDLPQDIIDKSVYRIEGSGSSKKATKTGKESVLEGDVIVNFQYVNFGHGGLLIEAKHRKSRTVEKSVSVLKEWVDQALHEAIKNNKLSVVAIKFKGVAPNSKSLKDYLWYDGKFGNSVHYIIPKHHFFEILRRYYMSLNSNKIDLGTVSTEDLINELKQRVK